jgi:hypothetical protein
MKNVVPPGQVLRLDLGENFVRLLIHVGIGLGALTYLFLPLNYVQPTQFVTNAAAVVASIAGICAILEIIQKRRRELQAGLLVIALVLLASSATSGSFDTALRAVLPIVVGMGLSTFISRRGLFVFIQVFVGILILETVLKTYWYSNQIGQQLFVSYGNSDFRARGIFGQAVPSGLTGVAMCAGYLVWSGRERGGALAKFLVVFESAAICLLTGTRSTLLLEAAAICCVSFALLGRLRGPRRTRTLLVTFISAVIGISIVGAVVPTSIWQSRLFDFQSLAGSASTIVRSNALAVVAALPDPCGPPCVVFGHGVRNLQTQLSDSAGILGYSTLDNFFVSLYWDVGAVGLVLFLGVAILSIRVIASKSDLKSAAGAVVALLIVFSGLFYDALYTRGTALVFGIALGACVQWQHGRRTQFGQDRVVIGERIRDELKATVRLDRS